MSLNNGHKSRSAIQRKKRIAQREKNALLAAPKPAAAAKPVAAKK